MPDAAPPTGAETADASTPHHLTPERIDQILDDFRGWLGTVENPQPAPPPEKRVDLYTLVEQFVALKQEVNLQTRAARTVLDQNSEALKQLAEVAERAKQPPVSAVNLDDKLKPLFKAMIDAYDSLALARRQIDKQRDRLDDALQTLQEKIDLDELPPVSESIPTPVAAVSFWSRLFGKRPEGIPEPNLLLEERTALDRWRSQVQESLESRQEAIEDAATFIDEALEGLLTGYDMSLSRIERVLSQFELEAIQAEGEPFDPESMEAVEAIRESGEPAGTVIEELRRGYLWRGAVFRYAQVKVAR